jgi:parallel beta-helix repeat protein
MSQINSHVLAVAAATLFCLNGSLFAVNVAVGPSSCQPGLVHFSTIQAAVAAVPPGANVLLCPGSYPEQVHITQPLTLRGVTVGNSGQAVIAPPPGGLTTNAVDEFGATLALQLWVDNASGGPVNISDIVVDGTGNEVTVCHQVITGIFYENSAGTVNHVTLRNQFGNTCGEAFLAEGGSASPTVTIQNSSIHNTDNGIFSQNQVTLIAKGNNVDVSASAGGFAITLNDGTTNTVSGNVIVTNYWGISPVRSATGSVSSNTVTGGIYGIITSADGMSITSNKVFNTTGAGIYLVTSVATIQNNDIAHANVGIEFNCVSNPNVIQNTINEAQTGLDQVPTGLAVTNTFFNALRTL